MPTSGPGSSRRRRLGLGFTLLELLMVVAIAAIAAGGVAFALRDSGVHQLERDGERLAALLESARARSRATGVPVRWLLLPDGFRFEGLGATEDTARTWLLPGTVVDAPGVVLLGPEPMLPPLAIGLSVPGHRLQVRTDGLRPFAVQGDGLEGRAP